MNYRLSIAVALLPMLVACGGSGGNDSIQVVVDPDRGNNNNTLLTEDRTRPAAGTYSTATAPIKDNGANPHANEGPQTVHKDRVASWPGLRFGDFYLINNPWNASAAGYNGWNQTIELEAQGDDVQAIFDWDWGAAGDNLANPGDTKSYPEVIYGTKSAAERSGTFQETGLPVQHHDMPEWEIEYGYWYEGRRSASSNVGGSDSDFNIAIESFYHDSCNIVRTGSHDDHLPGMKDNHVMEVMVWLKVDNFQPAGNKPPLPNPLTTTDGRIYDIYTKNDNRNYIAYVAREDQANGVVKYSEILHDAKDNAASYGIYQTKDTDCLANILFGTEIWHGAGTFTLSNYKIKRTY